MAATLTKTQPGRIAQRGGMTIAAVQAAVTGTATIATGLSAIPAGGAMCATANSATSATMDSSEITSVSGGSVLVAVALLTFTGPTIALEGSAKNVNVWALGT